MSNNDDSSSGTGLSAVPATEVVFRRLFDAAPDAVVVVDDAGQIVLANAQMERFFGYNQAELIGQKVEILIPERFHSAHVGHRSQFFSTARVRPMGTGLELFGRKQDGTEFPIEISLSPLSTDRGLLISASIRDISDRKRSEVQLRRIQGHLLNALESIQGGFAIFDVQDRLVLCNSTYRHLFGKDIQGDVIGRSFNDLLDAALTGDLFDLTGKKVDEFRSQCVAYHQDPSAVLNVRLQGGHSLRIVERRTSEGGTVMTIWDVTEDVEHELELRSARSLAEEASSAKSEFLASMSHELRTPLNAILGFAQLLQRDKKEPLSTRHQERMDHILKGGEHLLRLIDEVLDLARIEARSVAVSPEPIGIAEVLAEVKATLAPMAARAEIDLVVAPIPAQLPRGVADRTRFKQILMNLGSNAIKYGRRRGTATISAALHHEAIRVTVVDNGIGIPEDKQDKIFLPFHRAGQETGPIEGTGIGLAITKRLAELMEGRVGFQSNEGVGSEFWIEIPVHREVAEVAVVERAEQIAGNALLGPHGERYVVVYIEDNPSNIAFMEDLMADFERVELLTAPTAEIGIELVRARQPNIVIMDINLPGMSGFEATRQLKQWPETKMIPIIALSAAAMVRDKARVQDAGFYRYLTKPVKVDELAGTLQELLLAPPRS